jgi:RNase P subunit RPR2
MRIVDGYRKISLDRHAIEANRKKKKRLQMEDDEAFCLNCRQPVKLVEPETRPIKGKLIHVKGTCPKCDRVVNRGGRSG